MLGRKDFGVPHGMMAAAVSKSDKLGYVGAFPVPELKRHISAFAMGARAVNPKATVSVKWINAWFDPNKAREAAEALISEGAGALAFTEDTASVVQTAAARKIPQCKISVAKISENFSCFSQPTHPFFTAMADCVTRVRKQPTVFNVSSGFNDMHFFSHHLKIPTLGYGPGGEDFHAVNERAKVKELLASAKIYADLLTSFAG